MAEDTTDDTLLEGSTEGLLAKIDPGEGGMKAWSDEKRSDFVKLFHDRSLAAQYILQHTALRILEKGRERHFIGHRLAEDTIEAAQVTGRYGYCGTIGGRQAAELAAIALQRAKLILDELPPIKKAVAIIDPETAACMEKRDVLLDRLKELRAAAEELPQTILMHELDQDMTIWAFRAMVRDLEGKRSAIAQEMTAVGKEGQELESTIDRRLYKGLPGLAEAVRDVAVRHFERATALQAATRRVEERVRYGDDEGASSMLRGFEQDEVKVSEGVKAEFAAALEKLNLAGKKRLARGAT